MKYKPWNLRQIMGWEDPPGDEPDSGEEYGEEDED